MPLGLLKTVFLLMVIGLLNACVTTTNKSEPEVDLKKAEETHIQAGLGYLRQGEKESARRHFLKAVEFNPQSAGAHNGLALIYQLDDEQDLAEKHFKKSLSIDSELSLARNNYAALLFMQKRYQEAEKQLLQVVEDYSYERRDRALMNLGRTQNQLGKTQEAIKSLKQAIGINFRLYTAHLELADLYFAEKEYALAKRHLDQYAKLARHTPRSLWLGIRIERIFGNKDQEASYAMALKNLHQYSDEFLEYKKSIQ